MEEEKKEEKMSDREELIQSLIGGTSFLTESEINKHWTSSFRGQTFHTLILPVIFVEDPSSNSFDTVWKSVNHNIHLVLKYNFDGIILTNHGFMCKDLIPIIEKVRNEYDKLWIGVNFLGCIGDELQYLISSNLLNKVNGLWIENSGIQFANDSDEIIKHSHASDRLVNYRKIESKWINGTSKGLLFGGVEFNNNFDMHNSHRLCKKLAHFSAKGFMHCICVSARGDYGINKMECFVSGINNKCKLCISHGITAENVTTYLNNCSAIFLNKGLSDNDNFFNFNEFRMSKFRNVIESYYEYDSMDIETDNKTNKSTPGLHPVLSPVDEEPENKTNFMYDNDININDNNNNKEEEEEILYQIYIENANDINNDLNGIYKVIIDENKLPSIKHKTDSIFTPNFMYYFASFATQCEYGIFIIPSLESMNIYKPTWVIAQINNNNKQEPIYYYACQVNFKQSNALKMPPQCNINNINMNTNWLIVGDDGSHEITMKLQVLTLKTFDERRRNFSTMFLKTNKEKMKNEIDNDDNNDEKLELKEDNNNNNNNDLQIFDLDDTKVTCVEMVGINNILAVTNDILELKREWNECELGEHDELEMFLGAKGKVIDIEEDDDTVQLEWINYDYHWIPVKACWLTWRNRNITQPMYSNQEDVDGDSSVVNNAFGGGNITQ